MLPHTPEGLGDKMQGGACQMLTITTEDPKHCSAALRKGCLILATKDETLATCYDLVIFTFKFI
jgi:hypothetical protein